MWCHHSNRSVEPCERVFRGRRHNPELVPESTGMVATGSESKLENKMTVSVRAIESTSS